MFFAWRAWLRKWLSWATKRGTRWAAKFARPRRLAVEHLEDRVVPVAPPWAVSMAGDGTQVVFSPLGNEQTYTITAYEAAFVDGSRAAIGDVTGDGVSDLVTVAGFRGGPRVIVFDGTTGRKTNTFFAFESGFRGGAYVAVADVNGDKVPDIVAGAGESGSPRVSVFSGKDGSILHNFYAFSEATRTGVRVASADVDGDGFADIITAPGIGGNSQVRVFSGKTGQLLQDFLAFSASSQGGAFLASGDLNRDGLADIVVGAGQGDAPQLKAFSGRDANLMATADVYEPTFHGGVRVAVGGNADGTATSIWTAAGDGGGPRVREFDAVTMTVKSDRFVFDPSHRGGITVAAGFVADSLSPPVTLLPPIVPPHLPPATPPTSPPVLPVSPPISPPIATIDAVDDWATTAFETAIPIPVLANDTGPPGVNLRLVSATPPLHGSTRVVGSDVLYTPDANFSGDDSFSYTVSDGRATAGSAQVRVVVGPPPPVPAANHPPQARPDLATAAFDTAVTVDVLANDADPDGDALTLTALGHPANGRVAMSGSQIVYTPDTGFRGPDAFAYTIADGRGGTAVGVVTVTVDPPALPPPPPLPQNSTPQAVDDRAETPFQTAITLAPLQNDSDPDGDPIRIAAVGQPGHGTSVVVGADVRYTPDTDSAVSTRFRTRSRTAGAGTTLPQSRSSSANHRLPTCATGRSPSAAGRRGDAAR